MSEKEKILTKTVKFNGKELKLYSLDGNTWSSRKEELSTIKERFENTRMSMTLDGAKQGKRLFGKAKRPQPNKPAAPGFSADIEEDFDDDFVSPGDDVVVSAVVEEDLDENDDDSVKGESKKKKVSKEVKPVKVKVVEKEKKKTEPAAKKGKLIADAKQKPAAAKKVPAAKVAPKKKPDVKKGKPVKPKDKKSKK